MSMNIASRARNVARIFDILAWVVLVFGVLGAGIYFLVAVAAGAQDDNVFGGLVIGALVAALTLVYTALVWASITLGTVIAGYIAGKTSPPVSDYSYPTV